MFRKSILNNIGNTPLLEIEGIHVKAEFLNPTGSMKDRIAGYIIEKAEKKGMLKRGHTIVEASTGNTGTALAFVGAMKGYKVIIYIPRGLTNERYQMMRAFGAEVRLVPEGKMDLALQRAESLGRKPGHYHVSQFANPWNPEEHERHMSKEILRQLRGRKVDAVVNGIGTGGTIIGLGKAFKRLNRKCEVYGVEPLACASTYETMHDLPHLCKKHQIEGIGDSFVPPIVERDIDIIDDIIRVKSHDAINEARRIAEEHGCFVGVASGANLLAAKKLKTRLKTVVTIFTDEGEKYLSEPWFTGKVSKAL